MTDWRELHGATRTGKTKVWRIRQSGDTYHIEHGQLGGKMQSTSDTPGPKGREGTAAWMSAEDNCAFNVERLIRKKIEKGYVEVMPGSSVASSQPQDIDFSLPLSKSFCPYKPLTEKRFSSDEHERLFKERKIRYTRKRDGECHIAVHHTGGMGWRIYSRRIDDVTDRFPDHEAQLMFAMLPEGTVLVGEMVVERSDETDDTVAMAQFSRSDTERARDLVATGQVREPRFIVFDILVWGEEDLRDRSYDERMKLFDDVPLFHHPLFGHATPLNGITPKNWEVVVKKQGWEGLVAVDGTAVPGDSFFTWNGNAARPKGHFKLKTVHTEDVVVYAAVRGKGSNRSTIGSLLVKQRDPRSGNWFDCGKVGSGLTDDGGDLDRKKVIEQLKSEGVPIWDDERDPFRAEHIQGMRGLVLEVEFRERQPSGKLKFPVVKRVRNDKKRQECFAQNLSR